MVSGDGENCRLSALSLNCFECKDVVTELRTDKDHDDWRSETLISDKKLSNDSYPTFKTSQANGWIR